jgi:EmrB/QacA subfamily drug resistance transporter
VVVQAVKPKTQALRFSSPAGRWVLLATVLGSSVAALDATVVNVALPSIGRDLGTTVDGLQWILTGYLLSLGSLILVGGSLGDRFGRRRVFVAGATLFGLASLLCGVAPSLGLLVAARILQGVGGALLTPGSLAIIEATFDPDDRGQAIGAWSALGGIAVVIGPFVGGWLVQAASWRWIFLLTLPLIAAVVLVAQRHVPESADPDATGRIDVLGAALAMVGLAGTTYALIEAPSLGPAALFAVPAIGGLAALVAMVWVEARTRAPMLPLELFTSRQFSGANLVTLAVYAALSGVFFLLVVELQQVAGYTAVQSGAATIPLTIVMLALSSRMGGLAQRIGPQLPMTFGPLACAAGALLLTRVGPRTDYVTTVLPAVLVFGLGLSLTVAPLTATVLGAADARYAGVASAVNNAVARVGGLLAITLLPLLAGLTGNAYQDPAVFDAGYRLAMLFAAGLLGLGGLLAWLTIRNDMVVACEHTAPSHCALDAPPLRGAAPRSS